MFEPREDALLEVVVQGLNPFAIIGGRISGIAAAPGPNELLEVYSPLIILLGAVECWNVETEHQRFMWSVQSYTGIDVLFIQGFSGNTHVIGKINFTFNGSKVGSSSVPPNLSANGRRA